MTDEETQWREYFQKLQDRLQQVIQKNNELSTEELKRLTINETIRAMPSAPSTPPVITLPSAPTTQPMLNLVPENTSQVVFALPTNMIEIKTRYVALQPKRTFAFDMS